MSWESVNFIYNGDRWQFSSDITPKSEVYPNISSDINELGEIKIIFFNNQYVNIPRKHI